MRRSTTVVAVLAVIAVAGILAIVFVARPGAGPGPSPTVSPTSIAASPTPAPTAVSSPTPSPRAVPGFERALQIQLPQEPGWVAVDRLRVAFVAGDGTLQVYEVATGQTRTVHRTQDGWHFELDQAGLRGDTLVFAESRTDGQRTDGRIGRIDLRTGAVTTLDDFAGPFLGGGDTWRPRPPVTNGRDVAWIRVDQDRAPFGIHAVLARPDAEPLEVHSGTSIAWIDLDEAGRLLVSTLITQDDVAELVLWQDGQTTPLGTRPSGEGGPARFVGDRVYWQIGTGIVARSSGGELIVPLGEVRPLEHPDCVVIGTTGRSLLEVCGATISEARLHDPVSGALSSIPGVGHVAGRNAVVWREGPQWWLGTLAP